MQQGPAFMPLYQQRQQQWNNYMEKKYKSFLSLVSSNNQINNLYLIKKSYLSETPQNMARNDGFSRSAYLCAAQQMSEVMSNTDNLYQDAAENDISSNRIFQQRASDKSASEGFKLANLKSKFLKKK
jgi:hypothetical protein